MHTQNLTTERTSLLWRVSFDLQTTIVKGKRGVCVKSISLHTVTLQRQQGLDRGYTLHKNHLFPFDRSDLNESSERIREISAWKRLTTEASCEVHTLRQLRIAKELFTDDWQQ